MLSTRYNKRLKIDRSGEDQCGSGGPEIRDPEADKCRLKI